MPHDPLDLALSTGQRSTRYTFALSNGRTGANLGPVTPLRESGMTLEHDSTATISRRLTGLVLGADDAARLNPLTDRISVAMVTGGRTYPLGRYMIAEDIDQVRTGGSLQPLTLFDEMFIVDQPLDAGFDAAGLPVDQAILALLDGLPISEVIIDATDQVADNSWSAGTSRASALIDLATLGGYLNPWFTHAGPLRIMRAFEPANRAADIDLDTPPRVLRNSIAHSPELLNAPNRFVVVSNDEAAEAAPVVGVYDVPASAPHSIAQRGFVIPDVREAQLSSVTQAQVYARALGIQQTVYERAELSTPADPRHDGYTVVLWQGELWLETGWSMTLAPGAPMKHALRRAYPRTGEDE